MKLLETIKILDGEIFHLPYHQERLNRSLSYLNKQHSIALADLVKPPNDGLLRCRVVYDEHDISIEYLPYTIKKFTRLQAVVAEDINYPLKFANRDSINALLAQKGSADDILIIKHDLITDTSIANLAFYDGKAWYTPKNPLLQGTTRARLLKSGKLIEKDIPFQTHHKYEKIAIMNAMLGFLEIENGILSVK